LFERLTLGKVALAARASVLARWPGGFSPEVAMNWNSDDFDKEFQEADHWPTRRRSLRLDCLLSALCWLSILAFIVLVLLAGAHYAGWL
jgi:hypothetical protein